MTIFLRVTKVEQSPNYTCKPGFTSLVNYQFKPSEIQVYRVSLLALHDNMQMLISTRRKQVEVPVGFLLLMNSQQSLMAGRFCTLHRAQAGLFPVQILLHLAPISYSMINQFS